MRDDTVVQQRIGKNIKRLRNARGWSQEELAHRVPLSTVYIKQIEAGKGNPTTEVLTSIAKALAADFSELTVPPTADAFRSVGVWLSDEELLQLMQEAERLSLQASVLLKDVKRLKRRRR